MTYNSFLKLELHPHSPIPPNRKQLQIYSHAELWKMLSAVWVHDDFKLLSRLALELHAWSQINTSIGQISESIHQPDRMKLKLLT